MKLVRPLLSSDVSRRAVLAGVVGYVIGSAPSADVVTRLAASEITDLRAHGSGNPGAANAMKALGRRWGLTVLAADIIKGVVAGRVGKVVAGSDLGIHVGSCAAVVGHCLPLHNGFRGGKGVATSIGQVLVSFPAYFPLDLAVAVGSYLSPRFRDRAFVANTAASVAWVVSSVVWWRRRLPNAWGPEPSVALPVAAIVSSTVIFGKFVAAGRVDRSMDSERQ
jgi:acyl phosphate:glycerol-3-phosphate acyltransferase